MSLIKLSAGTDQYWLLNDVPHQRGVFDISAKIDSDTIEIYAVSTLKSLARGEYNEFSPDGVTPYASTQALINDLKAFFFRSVSGASGGVQSVTGDGVGGTATDPVISFPNADEVDDSATTNKFATQGELDQIGTNATNISNHTSSTANPHSTTIANLTDTTVNTPANNQVLTYDNGAWKNLPSQGFNPVTDGVLTKFAYNQGVNTAVSNAEPPNLTTYLTLVVNGVDLTSNYKFTCHFSIAHDATNSNAVVDIKDFGASILTQVYTVEPKDVNDRKWEGLEGVITPNALSGGQFQLQLDFGTDDNDDDTTMYFAFLSIQKIN